MGGPTGPFLPERRGGLGGRWRAGAGRCGGWGDWSLVVVWGEGVAFLAWVGGGRRGGLGRGRFCRSAEVGLAGGGVRGRGGVADGGIGPSLWFGVRVSRFLRGAAAMRCARPVGRGRFLPERRGGYVRQGVAVGRVVGVVLLKRIGSRGGFPPLGRGRSGGSGRAVWRWLCFGCSGCLVINCFLTIICCAFLMWHVRRRRCRFGPV